MILSHKHKFIFIKTNKTAGTSIEIGLSKFCGPEDIITPISSEDEGIRKSSGYRSAQNFLTDETGQPVFYNHMPAQEIKMLVGDSIWNSYYKFCFERNPWDRIISLYYWRNRSGGEGSIEQFIASELPMLLKQKGSRLYTIEGRVVVDKVCRYENIRKEMESIRRRFRFSEKVELPQAKSQYRKDKRHYRDIIGVKEKERIHKLFKAEIGLCKYKF